MRAEPGHADPRAGDRQQQVPPQAEDMRGGVDAQQFLDDAEGAVAGDVQCEQAGGGWPVVPEPRARGQDEVPQQLVEESRVEGRLCGVAVGPVLGVDLDCPRQVGGAPEEFLVEVVADAPDRLCDQERRRGGVHEAGEVGAGAFDAPEADYRCRARSRPRSPDRLPRSRRAPPVFERVSRGGREEVQASADDAGRKGPQRDS